MLSPKSVPKYDYREIEKSRMHDWRIYESAEKTRSKRHAKVTVMRQWKARNVPRIHTSNRMPTPLQIRQVLDSDALKETTVRMARSLAQTIRTCSEEYYHSGGQSIPLTEQLTSRAIQSTRQLSTSTKRTTKKKSKSKKKSKRSKRCVTCRSKSKRVPRMTNLHLGHSFPRDPTAERRVKKRQRSSTHSSCKHTRTKVPKMKKVSQVIKQHPSKHASSYLSYVDAQDDSADTLIKPRNGLEYAQQQQHPPPLSSQRTFRGAFDSSRRVQVLSSSLLPTDRTIASSSNIGYDENEQTTELITTSTENATTTATAASASTAAAAATAIAVATLSARLPIDRTSLTPKVAPYIIQGSPLKSHMNVTSVINPAEIISNPKNMNDDNNIRTSKLSYQSKKKNNNDMYSQIRGGGVSKINNQPKMNNNKSSSSLNRSQSTRNLEPKLFTFDCIPDQTSTIVNNNNLKNNQEGYHLMKKTHSTSNLITTYNNHSHHSRKKNQNINKLLQKKKQLKRLRNKQTGPLLRGLLRNDERDAVTKLILDRLSQFKHGLKPSPAFKELSINSSNDRDSSLATLRDRVVIRFTTRTAVKKRPIVRLWPEEVGYDHGLDLSVSQFQRSRGVGGSHQWVASIDLSQHAQRLRSSLETDRCFLGNRRINALQSHSSLSSRTIDSKNDATNQESVSYINGASDQKYQNMEYENGNRKVKKQGIGIVGTTVTLSGNAGMGSSMMNHNNDDNDDDDSSEMFQCDRVFIPFVVYIEDIHGYKSVAITTTDDSKVFFSLGNLSQQTCGGRSSSAHKGMASMRSLKLRVPTSVSEKRTSRALHSSASVRSLASNRLSRHTRTANTSGSTWEVRRPRTMETTTCNNVTNNNSQSKKRTLTTTLRIGVGTLPGTARAFQ